MAVTDSSYTQQNPEDGADEWSMRQFQIDQTLANVRTIVQVEVMSVSGGGVGAQPTVGVKPVVKIIDGQNNTSSHGIINNIQVSRTGSGNGSIIADPVVGDIGWLAVCDRDSSVVATSQGQESQPGSRRMFDLADGIYVGTMFGDAPTQYIQFTPSGITISDNNGNKIVMSSSGVSINGFVISSSGDGTTGSGIDLKNHVHSGVTVGGGSTGPAVG
jgi:hypothetical protein